MRFAINMVIFAAVCTVLIALCTFGAIATMSYQAEIRTMVALSKGDQVSFENYQRLHESTCNQLTGHYLIKKAQESGLSEAQVLRICHEKIQFPK